MTSLAVGLIGIISAILLIVIGMPVGFSLALIGFLGFAYLSSLEAALAITGTEVFAALYSYTFTVIPLFVLMGSIAARSGIGQKVYSTADKWLGHLPGGLALATFAGCAGFAAISNSSMATAATMCRVAFPEMEKRRYKPELSAGSIATGGTLGILIPPSGVLIVYGILTEESIGSLFVAAVLPGILHTLLYLALVVAWTQIVPDLAPPSKAIVSIRERVGSLGGTLEALLLFMLVIGGMFFGLFTPTEAGGVGVGGITLIAVSRKILNWRQSAEALSDTARTISMIALVLVGAMIFNKFLSLSRLPFELAEMISGLALSPHFCIIIMMLSYLVMGCLVDTLSMVLITVPIYFPLVVSLGFDPLWFGIIVVVIAEIGMITPPMGINVFIISGMLPKVPIQAIFKGVVVFLVADLFLIVLLLLFPQIVLFLPSLMR
ncbi:MAG: TRAP transporter large permease [Deltaproteobacteria bacterium]|nr:TRAP transporter large permease [Deltaproteobacteria bacterium]MBW2137271.1 TRAP transporter large permease [Deltaproteobacteria bacterium]